MLLLFVCFVVGCNGIFFHQGSDVNLVTVDHVSPLHEACLGGHAACASFLLKHGAKVSASWTCHCLQC